MRMYTHRLIGQKESVVNICLFNKFLFKAAFPTRKENNGLLFYIVSVLSVSVWPQHIILVYLKHKKGKVIPLQARCGPEGG